MRKRWIVASGILTLALIIGGGAEAQVNTCADAGGTQHIVDTAPEATAIGAQGYKNLDCHLIIQVSITPIPTTVLKLEADDITIDPAGGPTPGTSVDIINNNAQSVLELNADQTDINISEARLKAHKLLRIVCSGLAPPCDLIVRLSELVATLDFAAPAPGFGDVKMIIAGDIDIQTSTVHGGARLEMSATYGGLTLLCTPGGGGCKDPVTESNVSVQLCGTCPPGDTCPPDPRVPPAIFPCSVTFPTGGDLQAVCTQAPGVSCDGGSVEKRFTACEDINITGSTITSVEHMTFETKGFKQNGDKCDGKLRAAGANLTAESVVTTIAGDGTAPSIDLSDATINTTAHTTITAQPPATGAATGCPAAGAGYPANVCVNANGALVQASNIIMTAASGNGVIDLCGTAAAVAANPPTRPPQVAGATLINDLGTDNATYNADTTPPFSRIVGAVETILNGTAECTAVGKFGAYTDCTGVGGSCPPGIIDP